MSLGLKYKNNEQIFVERQRGGCAVPVLSAFWKIQESLTTDFLPDWVESVPGASVL